MRHQVRQVVLLERPDVVLQRVGEQAPRGPPGRAQGDGGLGCQARGEPLPERRLGVVSANVRDPAARRLLAAKGLTREDHLRGPRSGHPPGQSQGRHRRKDAQLRLRHAEAGRGLADDVAAPEGELEASAQALPAHHRGRRDGEPLQVQEEPVELAQQDRHPVGQVLLDGGAEAEVSAGALEDEELRGARRLGDLRDPLADRRRASRSPGCSPSGGRARSSRAVPNARWYIGWVTS